MMNEPLIDNGEPTRHAPMFAIDVLFDDSRGRVIFYLTHLQPTRYRTRHHSWVRFTTVMEWW